MISDRRDRWEIRLGLVQVIMLLGFLMGVMVCVFFFGYFFGVDAGYEQGFQASASQSIKLPIPGVDHEDEIGSEAASQVYAELHGDADAARGERVAGSQGGSGADAESDVPELGLIPTTEDAPVDEPLVDAEKSKNEMLLKFSGENDSVEKGAGSQQKLGDIRELEDSKNAVPEHTVKSVAPAADSKSAVVNTPVPVLTKAMTPTKAATATPRQSTPTPRPSPTPVVKAAEPTATRAVKASEGGRLQSGWFAQVAAPKRREDADATVRQLRAAGFAASIEVAEVKGQNYYRVMVGPESSKDQADVLVQQLKRDGVVEGEPFVRRVK